MISAAMEKGRLIMKINRYQIKESVTLETLLKYRFMKHNSPATYIYKDVIYTRNIPLYDDIELYIGFPEDLSRWNDFDYVLVMDDQFGQPYTPFHNYLNGKCKEFPYLQKVIKEYNRVMDSFDFLQKSESKKGKCL